MNILVVRAVSFHETETGLISNRNYSVRQKTGEVHQTWNYMDAGHICS